MINIASFLIYMLPPCVMLDRCSSRMVNQTRILKLKSEIKNLLFVAFRQKQTPQAKSLACLGVD
jgi:hypothetical protein